MRRGEGRRVSLLRKTRPERNKNGKRYDGWVGIESGNLLYVQGNEMGCKKG